MEKLLILIPSYNDWRGLGILLEIIDDFLFTKTLKSSILIIDDGSSIPLDKELSFKEFKAIDFIDILKLRRNLGHQRAIAIGLAYVEAEMSQDLVIVMDADGEDNPYKIDKLLTKYYQAKTPQIVFARRSKRSESRKFQFFYQIYRGMYKLLTGKEISFGNFSLIPRPILHQLVVVSEIWIHYASGVIKSRLPLTTVDIPRSQRLVGKSQMNFVSLVSHGLSSISIYGDVVGTRLLIATSGLIILCALLIAVVVAIRLGTTLATPGWATTAVGILSILMAQSGLILVVFSLLILASRNGFSFIPCRDYSIFILEIVKGYPRL
jgi:glycosyltransferase involved in cell wall biosynthesis